MGCAYSHLVWRRYGLPAIQEKYMKKMTIALITALSLAAVPAFAGHGHGHGGFNHGGYGHGGYSHGHGGRVPWAGVAAVGAVAGLAVLATHSRPVYAAPYYAAPAYRAPVVYSGRGNVWYYCRSSALYYPYTEYCPEGWQPVYGR
jgi:hypothetical protein